MKHIKAIAEWIRRAIARIIYYLLRWANFLEYTIGLALITWGVYLLSGEAWASLTAGILIYLPIYLKVLKPHNPDKKS